MKMRRLEMKKQKVEWKSRDNFYLLKLSKTLRNILRKRERQEKIQDKVTENIGTTLVLPK